MRPPETNVGAPVVATDLSVPPETLTYTLSGTDAGSFDINTSTGQLTVASGTALDHETKDRYTVIVTATDPVTTDDPTADSDSITVTITVNDVDESPALAGEDSVEYAENGLLPVATYTATDPEGESLDWDLSGADSGDFDISRGILSFSTAPDYESPADTGSNNVYEVTVEASDGTTSSATLNVTVTVTPVDEVHTLTELFRVASYCRERHRAGCRNTPSATRRACHPRGHWPAPTGATSPSAAASCTSQTSPTSSNPPTLAVTTSMQ